MVSTALPHFKELSALNFGVQANLSRRNDAHAALSSFRRLGKYKLMYI